MARRILQLFSVLLVPFALHAQQVGDSVIVLRKDAEIQANGKSVGKVDFGKIMEVQHVQGPWLNLDAAPWGWLNKRDAVRLDEGITLLSSNPARYSLTPAAAAPLLHDIAVHQQLAGELQSARRACREVLRIKTAARAKNDWQVIDARLQLEYVELLIKLSAAQRAELAGASQLQTEIDDLYGRGRYNQAIPSAERVIEIRRRIIGPDHSQTGDAIYALARLYSAMASYAMADYSQAESTHRQAFENRKRALGTAHPKTAESLQGLGCLWITMGDPAKASSLCDQAVTVFQTAFGNQDRRYLRALRDLALARQAAGEDARAEQLFSDVLKRRKALDAKDSETAESLRDMAMFYSSGGNFVQAEALMRQAVQITDEWEYIDNSDYLHDLGVLLYRINRRTDAESFLRRALDARRSYLNRAADDQSEFQQRVTSNTVKQTLDVYLSLAADSDESDLRIATESAYEFMLNWKGAVLRRTTLRRELSQYDELRSAERDLFRRKRELGEIAGRLAAVTPGEEAAAEDAETWRRLMDERSRAVELADKYLSWMVSRVRDLSSDVRVRGYRIVTPQVLRSYLAEQIALIDYYIYQRHVPAKAGDRVRLVLREHLIGFVLRKTGPIKLIDLGPTEEINQAIGRWREGLGGTEKSRQAGQWLRKAVWEPFEPGLQGANVVLVSPDGLLGTLPFPALPGRTAERYLIEETALAVVPVPQLLPTTSFAFDNELPPQRPQPKDHELLLLGDVDYNSTPAKNSQRQWQPEYGQLPRQRLAAGRVFEQLPGAAAEISGIGEIFDQAFSAERTTRLARDAASVERFREEAPRHRFLHLATHGFFAPPELVKALSPPGTVQQTAAPQGAPHLDIRRFHPGLLSGLVFAGANQRSRSAELASDSFDNGILSADEVSMLDLRRTELAVLSACQTGLGEVAGGEGLLGLQRAFQAAGARTTIASLWQVNDAATKTLMIEFYRNLWQKKLGKLEALRQSQLWMLREASKQPDVLRGLDPLPADQAHRGKDAALPPYYWAAFVLSGDWR